MRGVKTAFGTEALPSKPGAALAEQLLARLASRHSHAPQKGLNLLQRNCLSGMCRPILSTTNHQPILAPASSENKNESRTRNCTGAGDQQAEHEPPG
jgi:hypothetical protein